MPARTTFRLSAGPLLRLLARHQLTRATAADLGGWPSEAALNKQIARNRLNGYHCDELCIAVGTLACLEWGAEFFLAPDASCGRACA